MSSVSNSFYKLNNYLKNKDNYWQGFYTHEKTSDYVHLRERCGPEVKIDLRYNEIFWIKEGSWPWSELTPEKELSDSSFNQVMDFLKRATNH